MLDVSDGDLPKFKNHRVNLMPFLSFDIADGHGVRNRNPRAPQRKVDG